MKGKTPTTINSSLVNKNAVLDCTVVKIYIILKELDDCLALTEGMIFFLIIIRLDSFAPPHLKTIFVPFHALLRHMLTCQLQKQTNPAKTGLVRCLVSKSHGSEFCTCTCNCHVQRFFSLLPGSQLRLHCSQSQLHYEKKPSGTQGSVRL